MELALVSSHKINLTGNESVFEQQRCVRVRLCVRERERERERERARKWGGEL